MRSSTSSRLPPRAASCRMGGVASVMSSVGRSLRHSNLRHDSPRDAAASKCPALSYLRFPRLCQLGTNRLRSVTDDGELETEQIGDLPHARQLVSDSECDVVCRAFPKPGIEEGSR